MTAARSEPPSPDGLSHEEIARRLGLSRTRVRQIKARALAKLRTMLQVSETEHGRIET